MYDSHKRFKAYDIYKFCQVGCRHIREAGFRARHIEECRAASSADPCMSSLVRVKISAYEIRCFSRMFIITVLATWVCVCLRIFSPAAFGSATRAVFRVALEEQAGLDLTGPGRTWPLAFDGDSAAPRAPLQDLSVSDIPVSASLLPPELGTPSAGQGRLRR